jgi:hypothetical protein
VAAAERAAAAGAAWLGGSQQVALRSRSSPCRARTASTGHRIPALHRCTPHSRPRSRRCLSRGTCSPGVPADAAAGRSAAATEVEEKAEGDAAEATEVGTVEEKAAEVTEVATVEVETAEATEVATVEVETADATEVTAAATAAVGMVAEAAEMVAEMVATAVAVAVVVAVAGVCTGRPRKRWSRHRGCGSRGSRVVSRSPAGKRSR